MTGEGSEEEEAQQSRSIGSTIMAPTTTTTFNESFTSSAAAPAATAESMLSMASTTCSDFPTQSKPLFSTSDASSSRSLTNLASLPVEICYRICQDLSPDCLTGLPKLSRTCRNLFDFLLTDFTFAKSHIEILISSSKLKSVKWVHAPLMHRVALVVRLGFTPQTLRLFSPDFIALDYASMGPRRDYRPILEALLGASEVGGDGWVGDGFGIVWVATTPRIDCMCLLLARCKIDSHTLGKVMDVAVWNGELGMVEYVYGRMVEVKPTIVRVNCFHWVLVAAQRGHVGIVGFLLGTGFGCPSGRGNLALDVAASNGHLEVVRILLERCDVRPSSVPIRMAAENGHLDVIRLLLRSSWGLEPEEIPDAFDGNAFMRAARHGHVDIVRLLLTVIKIDVSEVLDEALCLAARFGHVEIVKLILRTGSVDPAARRNQSLQHAAQGGHDEIVKILLEFPKVDPGDQDNLALRLAAAYGRYNVVRRLIATGRCDVKACNQFAVRSAAEHGHVGTVQLLLSYPEVDPSANGSQALWSAAANGHVEMVKALLEDGRCDPGAAGNHAVKWSAANGHEGVVRLLLATGKVDVRVDEDFAYKRAVMGGHVGVKELLEGHMR
ncbi:hypothetical protein HDU97_008410 [Phlyctochytrium planicorne]|nr:hypothetical protein HDU97_008410 [Phlyctochytrium planicorne]